MALPPHWLDEVFENPNCAKERFVSHRLLANAFIEAEKAFRDQERRNREDPQLVGMPPNQQARRVFLKCLGLQVGSSDD